MKNDENRNMLTFFILMMVMLFAYQTFVVIPQEKKLREHAAQVAASQAKTKAAVATGPNVTSNLSHDQALALSQRVPIDTPTLKGSIALSGARLDDLSLVKYHTTPDAGAPNEELLKPKGAAGAYYVDQAWNGQNITGLPTDLSTWQLASGTVLSIGKPVTLSYDSETLHFERRFDIDDQYLITVTDKVMNKGPQAVQLAPFARVVRLGSPKHPQGMAFEGARGTFKKPDSDHYSDEHHYYSDWAKNKSVEVTSRGGWVGITDKYWLTALIPDQKALVNVRFVAAPLDDTVTELEKADQALYVTSYAYNPITIAPGTKNQVTHRVFAGAMQNKILKGYEQSLGIPRLHYSIDWGQIYFWLTQPVAGLLDFLYQKIGNFGLALLSLTVIIRLILYPFGHKAYESGMKMKAVQEHLKPKLDALKERFKDDPQKLQTETMALYQREKINPMAQMGGCVPMLLQFPVFIALTRVFSVSIDMRQAPFFNLIKDLSQRDPTTIFNLFGLLPYDPAHVPIIGGLLDGFGHIGIWAILYGAITWASQQITPMPSIDPTQKKMMQFMPIFIAVLMASLPAGLLIYYTWSTVFTIIQQYVLMKHFKVDNPIDDLIARWMGKPRPAAASGIIEGTINKAETAPDQTPAEASDTQAVAVKKPARRPSRKK